MVCFEGLKDKLSSLKKEYGSTTGQLHLSNRKHLGQCPSESIDQGRDGWPSWTRPFLAKSPNNKFSQNMKKIFSTVSTETPKSFILKAQMCAALLVISE